MTARPPARSGWFLYDATCGFCVKWVTRFRPILEHRGFVTVPLQTDWVGEALQMPLADLLHDVRLLTTENRLYSGVDAYLYAGKRIWWACPVAWLFELPGLHALASAAYRRVAKNRYCISGTCQLPPPR
jgi:predicted DCC family thiol-disulfide oxidoreductase YuxK